MLFPPPGSWAGPAPSGAAAARSRRERMNVEYTGRQFAITPAIRKHVEHGLAKLTKIIGDNFEVHVILTAEKYRHTAEITVVVRAKSIVGLPEGVEMLLAVGE